MNETYLRLIAEAVEAYEDRRDEEQSLEDFVTEYIREYETDIEASRFYGDDDYCDPYAYQQDLIDMRRFER